MTELRSMPSVSKPSLEVLREVLPGNLFQDANEWVSQFGLHLRIVSWDGEPLACVGDHNPDRVNVETTWVGGRIKTVLWFG